MKGSLVFLLGGGFGDLLFDIVVVARKRFPIFVSVHLGSFQNVIHPIIVSGVRHERAAPISRGGRAAVGIVGGTTWRAPTASFA